MYKDVPENSTVVNRSMVIIPHKNHKDNTFVANVKESEN